VELIDGAPRNRKHVGAKAMSQFFNHVAFLLLAATAGVSVVVQQVLNANLRTALGSAAWAGFVSYLVGTLCMLALALATRDAVPTARIAAQANWWEWSGGLFGAIFIAIAILLVPRLGAATFIALLIAGQMFSSVVIDHYGLFGMPEHPASVSRLAGALFLVGGVILIRF
jgi:bacterial/archaeal transporter family-2 protein